MDKVKKLVEAGASLPTAIKEAIGITLSAFAAQYELNATILSSVVNGDRRAPDSIISALVSHLGGTPDEWRMLLWEAARPSIGQAETESAEAEVL